MKNYCWSRLAILPAFFSEQLYLMPEYSSKNQPVTLLYETTPNIDMMEGEMH